MVCFDSIAVILSVKSSLLILEVGEGKIACEYRWWSRKWWKMRASKVDDRR